MTERPGDPRVPYYRWEQFCAYENGDGTAHVLVIDDSGGRLFADGFDSIEEAQWTCGLLNAAIGNKPQPPPDEFSGGVTGNARATLATALPRLRPLRL